MPTKAQVYAQLADETALKVTGSYLDWAAFLTTMSRLYKYSYQDQLLIHAQRPDATACAEYDLWNNTMHRYVRRGTKGIGLLVPGQQGMAVRYVFDVSDTGERHNSRQVEPWRLSEAALPVVQQMLEDAYFADASMDLADQFVHLAARQALSYWQDHNRDIIDSVDNSGLSGYDRFAIGTSFRKTAAASVLYTLQTRCGLEPELDRDFFTDLPDWNTPATVTELGKAVSTISGQVLRQIEAVVRQNERSVDHERTDLQTERRLPAAGSGPDRGGAEAAGQVRDDADAVSGGEPAGPVHEAPAEREADGAPAGDRAGGAEQAREPDEPASEAGGRDGGAEGPGSDGLGTADEHPEGAGGGADPVGADLRLTGHAPMSEQMSFLIPGEAAQIQVIDTLEAEGTQMPFAFSVPQEVVDEFLRVGSNSADHRMTLAAAFSRGLPSDQLALRVRGLYHGGNGLMLDGRSYSVWYDDEGIRIAAGKRARNVRTAQQISWEDAAWRIGELLESGQFLSLMELATTPAHERSVLAQRLWYLYGDIAAEGREFMLSMQTIRGGGFPEETARLADQLADPDFLSAITTEVEAFADAYRQNRDLMRFHFNRPDAVAHALRELALPRRAYGSLLTEVAQPSGFMTEDEIDAALSSGSSMAGGKGRIYRYFTAFPAHTAREKADFLKSEYGIGGHSHAVSGSDHSAENHDGKGIRLEKGNCPVVQLSWAQVAARIDNMIAHDRYMTRQELADIGAVQEEEPEEEPIHAEAVRERLADVGIVNGEVVDEEALRNSPFIQQVTEPAEQIQSEQDEGAASAGREIPYKVGDTVYLDDKSFVITQIGHFNVQLQDPSQAYPIFRSESHESLARLLAQDERNAGMPAPQSVRDKGTALTSEPVAIYPAAENGLPYDVVVERLHAESPEHDAPFPPAADNFRITDEHLGEGGPKAKFRMNMDAIQLLHRLEAEHRAATPEEQTVLSRYVGWGRLADAFDPDKPAWADEYRQLAASLTPEEYEAARGSTLNAHYTSPTVIRAMYDAVAQMGFTSGNILEPSMGVGNFFGMLPDSMQASRLYGVELDSITGRIAQQLYPKANITVAGFETTDCRDFFDLAIGNVPFGNYQVNDRAYNRLGFSIHNYFFAKAIDQVRPGGVIAFVTSRYTMDAQNPETRRYIAQRAELLGAIRLPNDAFRANAGTEVVSDILFLQKRERAIDLEPDWVHLGETAEGFPINSYFVEHPEMILGTLARETTQYGRESLTVLPVEGASLADQLHEAIQHIHGTYREAAMPDLDAGEASTATLPADPEVRNYSYTVVNGEVYYRQNSIMVKPDLPPTARERVKGMVGLRQCVNQLIQAQMENVDDAALSALQQELNTRYDTFTARFGLINARSNASAFADDSSYYLLCSLEVLDEQGQLLRKADMFTRRTIRQKVEITHVDTPAEALAVSIAEKAGVDLAYMARLTGMEQEQLTRELTGVIFPVPDSVASDAPLRYVTADEYLSGNVRRKLREARLAAASDARFAPNVTALGAAQPKDLDASEIDVRLGATWVDKEYINEFMWETFSTPAYLQRYMKVNYSPYTAEWSIDGKSMISDTNVSAFVTYGTRRVSAYRILEDTLNLRDVRVYDTVEDPDGKERRVLNQKETTLAQQKQQAIKDAYRDWLWRDPERREALVKQYNELFNATRPREYDGSHIAFVGMNPEITLREHQRNAVAHILYGGNTLLAHEVGAGKTFEMIAAAMESKRLGLCQKPMFVVPNHLTEQWASEFLRLYPSASILVTRKKDFERANRQRFCARIATGDYDAVIIGHSQFERIPVSQERQERLLKEQIDEITQGIEELKRHRGEQFTIKQLVRTQKQLETRLKKLQAEERKDDVVTFEQLGVDRLYVDEAHAYKNLFLATKMRNVAGLSASEAQKSSDMFMKCRYMDELTGGRGIVFATGTPVSNSMTELYTMQRYLQYDTLRRSSMTHFDCWASSFGETVTAIELAPEGTGYRARTRFAKFFNLPELMTMFKEVADIKTADQLHLPTPDAHYETVVVKPSAYQQEMVQALSERAAAVHSGIVDPSVDNMLRITSDGRKLGLDQRLINPLLPDDPGSKVNVCVGNILRIWREGDADKLTQLVFCDLSTPRGKAASDKEQPDEAVLPDETGTEDFNVYADIRAKLIAQGVPAEQIAFIHEANTEVRKKELFARVRAGQVRVLMGSTAKMGAGTNVQDRLVALHDLDCPWRPGDLEQRAGRIVRQGNQNKDVFIYRYVTEGTFDAYLWQTVENKQRFISQIMTSKSPVRSCDDVDETALSYAEIKALCAGDDRIREKMDLDVDVARLRLMKADHQSQQYRLEDQLLKYFPQEIERDTHLIAGFEQDIATLNEHPLPQEDFVGMTVEDKLITDKEEAGKAILAACMEASHGEQVAFGSYRGMSMSVQFDAFANRFQLTLRGAISHRMEVGNDARGNITRLDNAIAQIPVRMQATVEHLEAMKQQMAAAKQELGRPFPQEEELKVKSSRLAQLDAELNMDKQRDSMYRHKDNQER